MSIESGTEKPVFKNLQALRGIAALMVCTYHYSYLIEHPWGTVAFSHGWLGVQVFFIISGFIMVHTTAGVKKSSASVSLKFMLNRIIRIVPLYYLCTLIMIAPFLNDGYLVENGKRLLYSFLFISPMTSLKGPEYGMPALHVGWSLNYEMLFYLVFAVSLFLGKFRHYFLSGMFILAVFIIPYVSQGTLPQSYQAYYPYSFPYLNVLTNSILLHFMFGILFGIILPEIRLNRMVKSTLLLGALMIFGIYVTGLTKISFTLWNDLFFCGLLVFAFLVNDYGNNGVQLPPALVKIGDMSYSIYLLHPIIIIYLKYVFQNAGLGALINTTGFFIFAVCAVIGISFIFYKLIETRLTKYLKSKLT